MSRFTDLLANPFAEKRFLAILEPLDPRIPNPPAITPGKVVPFYFSTHGFTSKPTDAPANTTFKARMKKGYSFTRSLFSKGSLSGRTVPGYGSIELNNPDGALDDLDNLSWGGRRIRIFMGGKDFAFSEYGQIFEGTAQGVAFDTEVLRIELRSLEYLFDREIQTALFAGTGDDEGQAALKNRRRPKLYGICRLFEPVYLGPDSTGKHAYAINDGPIVGVLAVVDNGIALTFVASAPVAGQYTYNIATGTIRLGGAPVGDIRVIAIGTPYLTGLSATNTSIVASGSRSFSIGIGQRVYVGMMLRFAVIGTQSSQYMDGRVTAYSNTTGVVTITVIAALGSGASTNWRWYAWGTATGIMRQIATDMGVTQFDEAGLALTESRLPDDVGYWISEGGNALEVMDALADGTFSFWGFRRSGAFTTGYLLADFDTDPQVMVAPTQYTKVDVLDIVREPTEEPSWSITLRYQRTWDVMSNVAGAAAQNAAFTQEWRQAIQNTPDTAAIWKLSKPLVYDSLFDGAFSNNFTATLSRLYTVFGRKRGYYTIDLKVQPLLRDLGDAIGVTVPRYGFGAGRNAFVVDLDERLNGDEFLTKLGVLS